MTQLPQVIRFADLKAAGIVRNRVTLARWQQLHGFPLGRLLGPNTRTWSPEEIQAWLASRPTLLKPDTTASKKGGAQ
jgi:predicted DNA-binding transcriptional regulator AlpA